MSVKVTGLAKAIKSIEGKGDKVEKAVISFLKDTADSILLDAENLCPGEIDGVSISTKGRIASEFKDKGLFWNIGINGTEDFDAYVEFGTGASARQILAGSGYTNEMRAIAQRFFKNGEGTLIGKPFLYPSFIKNTANILEDLNEEITKATK